MSIENMQIWFRTTSITPFSESDDTENGAEKWAKMRTL